MMGWKESMMDHDNEELKKGCADHNCPGFVQVSRNVGLGGRIHPISIYNGPQYVINVLIFKDPKTENWWLAYGSNNTPIGYWPSSQFSYLKAKGDYAFWGGYVQGPIAASDPPQMGSGHFASEGFGKTTFIRNIQVIEDKNNKLVTPNIRDSDPFSSDPKLYSYDGYGLNDNGMHVYYGGPGKGEELKPINNGENTSRILTTLQVNKTIQMEPSSFPIGMDIKSPLVGAISQAQLSTIDCPIGTIPIVRNNSLANMMVQRIGTLANDDLPMLGAGIEYWDEIYGMQASINVYEPSVKKDSKDVSASWIQISVVPKGTNEIGIGAGSCVYPRSGDSFARFHIRWDNEELNKSCSDHNCPGFMQVSHTVGLGGRINPISVYNGPQYVINVLIFKDPKTKNWWLAYGSNNTPIGYWPSSQFSYFKAKGPTAASDHPQMGSGHFASEGFGKAAFIRNIQVIDDKDNKLVTPNIRNANPFSNNLKLYSYDGYGLNDDGGVKIHIDRDGIIGSTIPSKDLNMTIQMEPSSYPLDLDIQSILSSNISESNFPDIKCPTGTIPILRHNSSEAHMPNGGSQEEYAGIKYWDDNSFYGTHATLSVNQPFLTRNNGDHIASFVQLNNGPEEIAAGSIVWPSFSGDNFVSQLAGIGGRITPVSVYNGPQYIITVMLFQLFDTLQEKATYAFWGGWVRGPTVSSDPPPMGSGHFAKEGYRKAAFVKGIRIANKDNNFVNPNVGKATTVTTRGLCYTVDGFGVLKMGMHRRPTPTHPSAAARPPPLPLPARIRLLPPAPFTWPCLLGLVVSAFLLPLPLPLGISRGSSGAGAGQRLPAQRLLSGSLAQRLPGGAAARDLAPSSGPPQRRGEDQPIMSSLCPFAKLASAGATCPVKSDNKTTSCPVTANNHTDDDDNEKTGNANTDPRVVPAKCPFGYDSNNTFKLGPLSCVVCHALLHQSSKCTPCSHKFCKACILRFKDCPLCGADIQGIEPDDELQGLVDRFIDGHARIKRSHAAGDGEAASDKTKVIYEDVSMERGAFLVQQAMRAFRAQNIESAKSRLSMCAEDIREELKSKEDNQELRTLGDAPSAITYYEESAEFLSKLPKKDLEVLVHTLSVSLNKIGDLRYYDGDLHSARSYYAHSLDVRRSAAKEHSAVASQVIDVATSLAKVADVDRNLGNESMAVEGFEEAIKCLENLKLESGEASLEQRIKVMSQERPDLLAQSSLWRVTSLAVLRHQQTSRSFSCSLFLARSSAVSSSAIRSSCRHWSSSCSLLSSSLADTPPCAAAPLSSSSSSSSSAPSVSSSASAKVAAWVSVDSSSSSPVCEDELEEINVRKWRRN
uniref:Uncharacterized protein n=1 Tax=Oryza glumipatula TaxID=40148 RepID=A0A0D9YZM0_9ORYZ